MLQLTPHMRLPVCVDPVDFRKGIDGLVRICRDELAEDLHSASALPFERSPQAAPRFQRFLAP